MLLFRCENTLILFTLTPVLRQHNIHSLVNMYSKFNLFCFSLLLIFCLFTITHWNGKISPVASTQIHTTRVVIKGTRYQLMSHINQKFHFQRDCFFFLHFFPNSKFTAIDVFKNDQISGGLKYYYKKKALLTQNWFQKPNSE